MNIGERIRFFRERKYLTQRELGLLAGFPETQAAFRIGQYESSVKTPNDKTVEKLAKVLGVSPLALRIPDISDPLALLHLLFVLEDVFGAWVEKNHTAIALNFDPYNDSEAARFFDMLCEWRDRYERHINGKISIEDYDNWRYNFTDEGGDNE